LVCGASQAMNTRSPISVRYRALLSLAALADQCDGGAPRHVLTCVRGAFANASLAITANAGTDATTTGPTMGVAAWSSGETQSPAPYFRRAGVRSSLFV
jgi:hypothetical protein